MEIDNKPKYYGSMVRVSVTTKGGIEYTVHLEDVDAIPIEWIKKHYGWLTMAGEMIVAWEKENETTDKN